MIEDASQQREGDILKEAPRNIQLFRLPELKIAGRSVRMGMHMDTLVHFVNYLERNQHLGLKIQGRIINYEQWLRLQKHPTHRFFMGVRVVRAMGENNIEYVRLISPKDFEMSSRDILSTAKSSYSPSTLASEIGFQVGWYDAATLLKKRMGLEGIGVGLLPILEGCNEFAIGSGSLNQDQLISEIFALGRYLYERDSDIAALIARLPNKANTLANLGTTQAVTSLAIPTIEASKTHVSVVINSNKYDL